MECGTRKCGILGVRKGKYEYSEGIHLPSEEEIKESDGEGTNINFGVCIWSKG